MKTSVTVSTSLRSWKERYQGKLTQLYLFTAAQLQTNRGMIFMHEGSYNGHERWAPLKLRDGQPLRDRGTLMKSIGPISKVKSGVVRPSHNKGTIVRYGSDKVTIGTTLAYAKLMNDGGVIIPKKGKVLWIPLPEGKRANADVTSVTKGMKKSGAKKGSMSGAPIVRLPNGKFFMLAKKVTIPPRPFDKMNAQDKEEIHTALTRECARVLNE
jgi:phage gpG-like protein